VSGDLERYAKMVAKRRDMTPAAAFVDLDRDEFQEVMEVNLTGTMLSLQACLAAMLDHGAAAGSSLITVASIAAKHPAAGTVPYGTSKAAVWYLTKMLAYQLAAEGIRVNSVGPGFIRTNMTAIIDLQDDDRSREFYKQIPMGHMGEPLDIANAALFLASDESKYMTGEILHPDGGFYTE
jgi:NAD(P)-dependent dehydrogenase (short-subunit alcohol dehydrogenase family)